MSGYDKETIRLLVKGELPHEEVRRIQREPKDEDRFKKYLEVWQEETKLLEPILIKLGEHLYIVEKKGKGIVKCDCGFEFGDYRVNWKLAALIHVRRTEEELDEIYPGLSKGARVGYEVIREYCCPGCGAQLDVEAVPPGYPITFECLPDLGSLYSEVLGRPLKIDASFEDKTYQVTQEWGQGR